MIGKKTLKLAARLLLLATLVTALAGLSNAAKMETLPEYDEYASACECVRSVCYCDDQGNCTCNCLEYYCWYWDWDYLGLPFLDWIP